MAETLKIENFGPIKKANLKLGKTTVFIGEQSSGKSTIAKLIAIFRDVDVVVDLMEFFDLEIITNQLRTYNLQEYWQQETVIDYRCDLYSLTIKLGYFSFSISDKYPQIKEFAKSTHNRVNIDRGIRFGSRKPKIYSDDWALLYQLVLDVLAKSVYIPAERILLSTLSDSILSLLNNNIPLPKFLLQFGSEIEQTRPLISKLNINALSLQYIRENNQDWVIDKAGKKLKVSNASSGIQANIPLFIVLEGSNNSGFSKSFIVEEPELNLFPSTQLKLINTLGEKCTKGGNQLVITTHSPYVLTALNNLLFAYKTASKKPDAKKKINKVIPEASWLNPDEFKAYYVGKGTVKSIIDKDNGLIGENHLDDASYDAKDTFYQLMQIYKD